MGGVGRAVGTAKIESAGFAFHLSRHVFFAAVGAPDVGGGPRVGGGGDESVGFGVCLKIGAEDAFEGEFAAMEADGDGAGGGTHALGNFGERCVVDVFGDENAAHFGRELGEGAVKQG